MLSLLQRLQMRQERRQAERRAVLQRCLEPRSTELDLRAVPERRGDLGEWERGRVGHPAAEANHARLRHQRLQRTNRGWPAREAALCEA